MGIRNVLKRVLPLPATRTRAELAALRNEMEGLRSEIAAARSELGAFRSAATADASRQFRYVQDCVWANVFNNTIEGSDWLKAKDFTPGRAAVGYSYLYVMFRVLNACGPKCILDIGLGQSSKMFAQYAAAHPDVAHVIVESDRAWADFFQRSYELSPGSQFVYLDYEMVRYKDCDVRAYRDFKKNLSGRTYDFISVDAPFSCDMKSFARLDVLDLIPECLADKFVIMVDDVERPADNAAIGEIRAALDKAGRPNIMAFYGGRKDCAVITVPEWNFLATL